MQIALRDAALYDARRLNCILTYCSEDKLVLATSGRISDTIRASVGAKMTENDVYKAAKWNWIYSIGLSVVVLIAAFGRVSRNVQDALLITSAAGAVYHIILVKRVLVASMGRMGVFDSPELKKVYLASACWLLLPLLAIIFCSVAAA